MRHFFALALGCLAIGMVSLVTRAADVPATTYVHAGKLLDVRSGKMLNDQVMRLERWWPKEFISCPHFMFIVVRWRRAIWR